MFYDRHYLGKIFLQKFGIRLSLPKSKNPLSERREKEKEDTLKFIKKVIETIRGVVHKNTENYFTVEVKFVKTDLPISDDNKEVLIDESDHRHPEICIKYNFNIFSSLVNSQLLVDEFFKDITKEGYEKNVGFLRNRCFEFVATFIFKKAGIVAESEEENEVEKEIPEEVSEESENSDEEDDE